MATLGAMAEAASRRLVLERIEYVREQLTKLQDRVDRFDAVADALTELPNEISHKVMVPLGKRAMIPGKIVHSNEVLANLGDEYFSWRSATQALDIIKRKKEALLKQIQTEENNLQELNSKKTDVDSVAQLQKMFEDENIVKIQETEEESQLGSIPIALDEDIKEYFELEEEERLKQDRKQAAWNWDGMMKRMEDLEKLEAAGARLNEEDNAVKEIKSVEAQIAALKANGNNAFAKRRFKEAVQYYSQAIELNSTSHILYGNRAAAYHRLKNYKLALEDSDVAISLHEPWVKGHYRKACALAALEKYKEAAEAFERAKELSPSDKNLEEKAKQMRDKANDKANRTYAESQEIKRQLSSEPPKAENAPSMEPTFSANSSTSGVPVPATSASTAFSGSIMEHESYEALETVPVPVTTPFSNTRTSRFQVSNHSGQIVTLEPVGEAQPVKRVSRFKAARARRD
ncbi:hypothetical protein CCR75_004116 [Bremia lactucae]|uniref:Uncharacterized protein n=1 Tax=Bremia lactucae TaxID=4779 RepID=A0A976FKP4_BRELC|nr:hypothetical protein CCR75_004116 [Bremia lactucae]